MGISNRVNAGRALLDVIKPKWEEGFKTKGLTLTDEGPDHLLSRVFGSYDEGIATIRRWSSFSPAKLGFKPGSKSGTAEYKQESASLRDRWILVIESLQNATP